MQWNSRGPRPLICRETLQLLSFLSSSATRVRTIRMAFILTVNTIRLIGDSG